MKCFIRKNMMKLKKLDKKRNDKINDYLEKNI